MNSQKRQIKPWKVLKSLFLMHQMYVLLKYLKQKIFTLEEMLVKPCILFEAKEAWSPQAAQKLERIPLFNNTVQRNIEDMLTDIVFPIRGKI